LPQEFNIADEDYELEAGEPQKVDAEVAARTLQAREARLAIVGLAEAHVRARGDAAKAGTELRRFAEEQETERCRIVEEARTRRVQRLAETAELLASEQHRTQRERDALRAQALRATIAVRGQVEAQRLQMRACMMNFFEWMAVSLVGALGVTAASPGAGAARGSGALKRRTGVSSYFSAFVLVALVRHLWLSSSSRKFLVWSGQFGPFLRGALSRMLQASLSILLQGMRTADPAADTGRGGCAVTRSGDEQDEALRPLPGPEVTPECWVSHEGPDGRTFWHHTALGPPPWEHCGVADAGNLFGSGREDAMAGVSRPRGWSLSGSRPPPEARHLRALLANWGLGEYAKVLEENGYDSEAVRAIRPDEVDEMFRAIACQEAHRDTFRRALDSWR